MVLCPDSDIVRSNDYSNNIKQSSRRASLLTEVVVGKDIVLTRDEIPPKQPHGYDSVRPTYFITSTKCLNECSIRSESSAGSIMEEWLTVMNWSYTPTMLSGQCSLSFMVDCKYCLLHLLCAVILFYNCLNSE